MTPTLCFDTETHMITPGNLLPPLVCVSTCEIGPDGQPTPAELYDAKDGINIIRRALVSSKIFVGHNIAWDFAVLCRADPDLYPLVFAAYDADRIRDTKIREELMDIAKGRISKGGFNSTFDSVLRKWVRCDYSLAGSPEVKGSRGLVYKYLGKDRSAQKLGGVRTGYAALENVPIASWPAEAVDYAKEDASDTLSVFLKQGGGHELAHTDEPAQCRAAFALTLMSARGIMTDAAAVAKLKAELEAERARNRKKLIKIGFLRPKRTGKNTDGTPKTPDFYDDKGKPCSWSKDMGKIKAYVERCYTRKGLTAPKTDSGAVSTDKDVLAVGQSGSRLLDMLSGEGGVDKILDTYIPLLEKGTNVPINARFNVLVNSGRTSCSRPNLQNIPTGRRVSGVRDCFVPRPGYAFISVDYNTLELRTLAQVCLWLFGKSAMAEALQAGRDLHLEMAGKMLGISYEDTERRYEAGDPEVKNARDCAKVANFGLPGGLGVKSLVSFARKTYGVTLTEKQAAELKKEWLAAWPEMKKYFAHISQLVGYEEDAKIVQFVSNRIRGGVGYCDGCNTFFQGLAADGAKHALYEVTKQCYLSTPSSSLFGALPVVFVHDEIILEAPLSGLQSVGQKTVTVMCTAMAKFVPDVPITAAPAAMLRWYKKAEPKYDANNELIPWEPEHAKKAA
jgi:hypothetical protein